MKSRSLLTKIISLTTISLAILTVTSLPIIAGTVRLPTDAEMQELIKKFRSFAAAPPSDGRGIYSIVKIGTIAL